MFCKVARKASSDDNQPIKTSNTEPKGSSAHTGSCVHGELDNRQPVHLRYAHGRTRVSNQTGVLRPSRCVTRTNKYRIYKREENTKRADSEVSLTLCLDERFCNLSFGCLNSFVFICPGSQKNLTVNHSVTPWARWAEDAGRRFTHLTSPRPSSRGKNSC